MARFLLVVPLHNDEPNFQPGGQVTAASGLRDQLRHFGHGVDVINVVPPNFTSASGVSKMWSAIKRLVLAWKMLGKGRYDFTILFTGSLFNLPERLLIAAFARIRGVKTALFFRNSSVLNIPVGSIRGRILARSLAIPHFLVVQGKAWEKLFVDLRLSPQRVAVVPNWLPANISVDHKARTAEVGETVRFVFVGRLTRDKGVFDLAEAVTLLADRSNFEVYLVGDGDALGPLKQLVADRHLGQVRLLGWQDRDSVSRILEGSHIFVLPSYREGLPNAILEGMAHGLPVIATDTGAISESVQDGANGFLITPKALSELAGAMARYLDDPALVSEHSTESLRIVRERHDREINCQLIVDLLLGEES
jgi:glycosyltransferase involved in cell wall biosynthesis